MTSKRRTFAKWFAAAVAGAILTGVAGSHAAGPWFVKKTDARQPRNADGILSGAAPRDLGPEDAECAVLLVHGYLGCGNNFGELPERLAETGCRVRVMLLPGHGTSPRDLAKTTGSDLLGAVLDEIDLLRPKHKRLVLVGHSMGGTLCTLAAAERDIDALVLAAPYFAVTGHWYYGLKPETWARLTAPVLPWLYKGSAMIQVNKPDDRDKIVSYKWVPASSVNMLISLARKANNPEVLQKVACPVIVIHSRKDEAACPITAKKAFQTMAAEEKKFVLLNRSNHIIFWDYEAEQAIEEVVKLAVDR